jgi:hypothetical protein
MTKGVGVVGTPEDNSKKRKSDSTDHDTASVKKQRSMIIPQVEKTQGYYW